MTALSRLLEPPRLRTLETEADRRATWLELFFDLVFVVAIAELGTTLAEEATLEGLLQYLALFVPVWWAWAGFTFYANRFDTDDLVYRFFVLVGMFAVAALATNVHDAFEGDSAGFALSYVCIRGIILVLYARAIRFVPAARALATWYFTAFSLAVVAWLASLAFAEPARYWLWALALALELGAPVLGWRLIPRAPIDVRHIPERFGLLTIIVLGESVLAVVLGVSGTSWRAASAAAALGGFTAAAAVWWIYFDFLDESMVRRSIFSGLVFTYAHFLVVAGIAGMGVGVKLAILSAAEDEHYAGTGWVFPAGLALAMLGLAAIQLATPPAVFDADVWLRLAAAAVALFFVALGLDLHPLAVVWPLAGFLVAQVVFELLHHERHRHLGV